MIISALHGLKRLHDKAWNFNPGVELGPGLKILSCNRAFDFDRVYYYRQGWNFNPVNGAEFDPGTPLSKRTLVPGANDFLLKWYHHNPYQAGISLGSGHQWIFSLNFTKLNSSNQFYDFDYKRVFKNKLSV